MKLLIDVIINIERSLYLDILIEGGLLKCANIVIIFCNDYFDPSDTKLVE